LSNPPCRIEKTLTLGAQFILLEALNFFRLYEALIFCGDFTRTTKVVRVLPFACFAGWKKIRVGNELPILQNQRGRTHGFTPTGNDNN
jgi:hypothetical protein